MEELIRSVIQFDGALNQDVIQWLEYIEEVFDRVQLQTSNKYIAIQYFLTNSAATWFKYKKSNIPDWFTFKRELIEAFQSSSSFSSSHLLDRHQLIIKEEPQKLEQEQDILPVSASTSTISNKKNDSENYQLDLLHDGSIKSLENLEVDNLEDKCLREHEQGYYSSMLVNTNDFDLDIQHQDADAADSCDTQQQGESVINSDSVQTDIEDTFEDFTRPMDSLTGNDSLINIVLPHDVQYLWSDKYKPRPPRILNKAPAVYNWNRYNKLHCNKDDSPPPTIQENQFNTVSKEWNYTYNHGLRFYFYNEMIQLRFSFRKWKYRLSTLFCFRKWKYRRVTFSVCFYCLSFKTVLPYVIFSFLLFFLW
ncbi:unnamed protein product [Rotaria sordida]|uniref:Splicing factor Cactin C-terminal domain-containing protein n=1 Tax=Rotaria sordida TaxID=392033 RepID=A0A819XSY0_9BILA|nr:unnamed protein product [Rotaria sordida]